MNPPSVDYIYWTFSSAAQSISAFVALLLTGYAIVHTLMEAARERDDSLEEIHAALRVTYHRRMTILAWTTGLAILVSLFVLFDNRPNAPTATWILGVGAALNIAAVIGGIAFVISVVNPTKYEKAAQKLEEGKRKPDRADHRSSSGEFFDAFLRLERVVRDYLKRHDLYVPSRNAPRMSFSFRQMIEALLQSEKIDRALYEELMEVNKYRNLVFHGHLQDVDPQMIAKVKGVTQRLASLR